MAPDGCSLHPYAVCTCLPLLGDLRTGGELLRESGCDGQPPRSFEQTFVQTTAGPTKPKLQIARIRKKRIVVAERGSLQQRQQQTNITLHRRASLCAGSVSWPIANTVDLEPPMCRLKVDYHGNADTHALPKCIPSVPSFRAVGRQWTQRCSRRLTHSTNRTQRCNNK